MKKQILTTISVICCTITISVLFACSRTKDSKTTEFPPGTDLVLTIDTIVIKPYLNFGVSLAEVEEYMSSNYPDYIDETPDELLSYAELDRSFRVKRYAKDDHKTQFYFPTDETDKLQLVSYDFFTNLPLEAVIETLENNGFTYKGIVEFEEYNADICYIFLSPLATHEVLVSSWNKYGGSWSISFLPTDMYDLHHIVN